jgi:hypothetical protein
MVIQIVKDTVKTGSDSLYVLVDSKLIRDTFIAEI